MSSDKLTKQNVEKAVDDIYGSMKSDPKEQETEQARTYFKEKSFQKSKSLSQIRQRGLLEYYKRFNDGKLPRGSDRTRRRAISRWLDKVEARFADVEGSFDFRIVSQKYATVLYATVMYKEGSFHYSFEFS